MRLSVTRTSEGPRVVVDHGVGEVLQTNFPDLASAFAGGLMTETLAASTATGVAVDDLDLGPAVGAPGKVICVGHNFKQHILEMGHGFPDFPNVFSKFSDALVGPSDPIALDPASEAWDWEAELALVIGTRARRVAVEDADRFIAGYTVANDISARDWQKRATQWLLGKTFESTTPIGPWIVSADEVDPMDGLAITCSVDGVVKQQSSTSDLLFGPHFLVSYLSQVMTLQPGDVVLTGTPAGVGAAREPAEWLSPGQVVVTEIEGLGQLSNLCTAPALVDA